MFDIGLCEAGSRGPAPFGLWITGGLGHLRLGVLVLMLL